MKKLIKKKEMSVDIIPIRKEGHVIAPPSSKEINVRVYVRIRPHKEPRTTTRMEGAG